MGLDMYLTKKHYIGAEFKHRKVKCDMKITIDGKPVKIDTQKIDYVEESFAYWRKANHIHKWFVENVQNGIDDCGNYDVELEHIESLLKTCLETKEMVTGLPKKMKSIKTGWADGKDTYSDVEVYDVNPDALELPTQSGFFFGSTNIDDRYLQDIEYTIKICKELIDDKVESTSRKGIFYFPFNVIYHSSW